ncbi:MAG: NAD(P)/FAD-dependent oxidoreductase [Rhodospirillaceae bacterium]|jgi:flavin-dependent dehydrogenase|nr:NAD(P)/FAD-dependent oxidoreductase [Rhodospirillaceae bacterium]MBT3493385.1 NAD(P)/FAD-dependent oxidoreductase [Rhodospirillaceae bacterium]MBT3778505.1 NAD(P)/FAD-dependent oxidoreductase [Rhodospirillaceae bacterium]MBT3975035.1 NAD(P)/FAD-dependent oxidoreductase [Rhodospirillaceae bacterium]MBT4170488.1 NAD(P)/FAD-dependent oxidoreductase [Rhodospirillaceae bacterium]
MSDIQNYEPSYDAVIVGARCAGAATAMLLARAGANVLLVDRQQYGSDVVSTHALMRAGVLQLARWGVLGEVMAAGTPAVTQTAFHYGDQAVQVNIKPEHGVEYLCAPRRTVLDRVLVDAAKEAGVDVRHGVTLTNLQFALDGQVTGVHLKDASGKVATVRAGVVIGADGRQSVVARRAGARTYVQGPESSGYVYGYFEGLANDGYHWYFEDGTAAGVIPTNDNQHCVFVGVHHDQFASTFRRDLTGGFSRMAAANSPALRDALDNARMLGRLRGFSGGCGYFRQSYGPGWALDGDAGYFKDPLTAHGITDAFRDAELLSQAVCAGSIQALAQYQDERDTLSRPLFDVTNAIASFQWDLDEIKLLHGQLSDAMKTEANHVAGFSAYHPLAA